MNIDKYQEFADYLRRIVDGERDQCVIDKNLLLTAAAAIDELSGRILNDLTKAVPQRRGFITSSLRRSLFPPAKSLLRVALSFPSPLIQACLPGCGNKKAPHAGAF